MAFSPQARSGGIAWWTSPSTDQRRHGAFAFGVVMGCTRVAPAEETVHAGFRCAPAADLWRFRPQALPHPSPSCPRPRPPSAMHSSRAIYLGIVFSAAAVLLTIFYHYRYYGFEGLSLSAAAADYSLPNNANIESLAGQHLAYATFLSTRVTDDDVDDPYFTAARVLAYQLLHAPDTRTQLEIPFLVLVTPAVSTAKRARLRADGATVISVDLLSSSTHWETPGRDTWVDQFAKLRLFELTAFDRILYLDGDMLLTRPLDGIWLERAAQPRATRRGHPRNLRSDEAPLPETYLLAGIGDIGGADHAFPPPAGGELNGGFFMLKPSRVAFDYYCSVLELPRRFDASMMEQNLLRYAHRRDGNMPWTTFAPGRWNVNWPRLADLRGGVASLHDKFWEEGNKEWIERELVVMWWRVRGEMEGYWQRVEEERDEIMSAGNHTETSAR